MKLSSRLIDFFSALIVHVSMRIPVIRVAQPPAILKERNADPPWLLQMKKYVGQLCPTGKPPTAFIRETFKHTTYPLTDVTPPACAAGLNRCLEEVGILGTKSAAAKSFLEWGIEHDIVCGSILVFRWPAGDYHVTLFAGEGDANTVACLGFNQNHKVQLSVYARKWIVGVRWPVVAAVKS